MEVNEIKDIFTATGRQILTTVRVIFLFFILAIGLLYVKASVWQMLRGSIIIFTGLLSVSI